MKLTNEYFEAFYSQVILIFWVAVPAIIGLCFFIFFCRVTNAIKKFKNSVKDSKWQVKWGYRWNGTPYIKDQGWGTKYSKLSKLEYFTKLNEERKNQDGKAKQVCKD